MKRIESFQKMAELEERKERMEGLKNDVNNYYTNEVIIYGELKSSAFNRKYDNKGIKVTKTFFTHFLETEIEKIDEQINSIMEGLVNDGK